MPFDKHRGLLPSTAPPILTRRAPFHIAIHSLRRESLTVRTHFAGKGPINHIPFPMTHVQPRHGLVAPLLKQPTLWPHTTGTVRFLKQMGPHQFALTSSQVYQCRSTFLLYTLVQGCASTPHTLQYTNPIWRLLRVPRRTDPCEVTATVVQSPPHAELGLLPDTQRLHPCHIAFVLQSTDNTSFLEHHCLESHVGHSHHEHMLRHIHDAIRCEYMVSDLLWTELHHAPIRNAVLAFNSDRNLSAVPRRDLQRVRRDNIHRQLITGLVTAPSHRRNRHCLATNDNFALSHIHFGWKLPHEIKAHQDIRPESFNDPRSERKLPSTQSKLHCHRSNQPQACPVCTACRRRNIE